MACGKNSVIFRFAGRLNLLTMFVDEIPLIEAQSFLFQSTGLSDVRDLLKLLVIRRFSKFSMNSLTQVLTGKCRVRRNLTSIRRYLTSIARA